MLHRRAWRSYREGLNPCFNGICSLTVLDWESFTGNRFCLNPCFNGICSLTWGNSCLRDCRSGVLILVLMEYALWPDNGATDVTVKPVLILVLMEYALWRLKGLMAKNIRLIVLILVLMEYALWLWVGYYHQKAAYCVLILVLMEYALWQEIQEELREFECSLNPCFNGIYSLTWRDTRHVLGSGIIVLILVLMEYALWLPAHSPINQLWGSSLNPCFNGICSLTTEESLKKFLSLPS